MGNLFCSKTNTLDDEQLDINYYLEHFGKPSEIYNNTELFFPSSLLEENWLVNTNNRKFIKRYEWKSLDFQKTYLVIYENSDETIKIFKY